MSLVPFCAWTRAIELSKTVDEGETIQWPEFRSLGEVPQYELVHRLSFRKLSIAWSREGVLIVPEDI